MKKYTLGNWMRGAFEGEFATLEEAWEWLSDRFLLSYPSNSGRQVFMYVDEPNTYGFQAQQTLCKEGVTSLTKHPEEEVIERCTRALIPNTSL